MTGIGIVGCGYISQFQLQGLKQAGGRLVAACDINADAAKKAAEPFKARCYTDYDKLLADKDVQAVIISMPNYLHFEFAGKALAAGKHVFCEKQMTTKLADSEKLVDIVRKSGKVFQVGYMKRFNPAFGQIKKELPKAGRIFGATIKLYCAIHERPSKAADPKTAVWQNIPEKAGGGFLVHSASHLLDLMQYTFGPPVKVWGKLLRDPSGNEYDINAVFLMESDYFIHFQMGLLLVPRVGLQNTFWEETVEVASDQALIRAEGSDWQGMGPAGIMIRQKDSGITSQIFPDALSQWTGEFEAFLKGIEQGKCLACDVTQGYRVDKILDVMKKLEFSRDQIEFNFKY
ncbi:MAG: Gfo/Idh/MocA family oxidoreductase [Planctomycetota bacterium]